MPILAMSSGTVTAVWGQAFLRLPNGQLRPVKVGDKVAGGQQIVTEDNGLVQIAPEHALAHDAAKPADAVIADLNALEPLDPPGAGLQGGLGGALSAGLRVDRIAEGVTPLAFSFGTDRELPLPGVAVTAPQASAPAAVVPTPEPANLPQVSVNDVRVNEGAGVATFTLTLSQASTQPVTVTCTTRSGTAVVGTGEGADVGVVATTVTFQPGQTSVQVAVPIVNDRTYEGSETFQLVLGQPVNATIGRGTGTGTILDDGTGPLGPEQTVADDDRPAVQISAGPTVVEGSPAVFTLTLTHPSNFPVGVTLKLLSGLVDPVTGLSQYITPGVDNTPLEVLNPRTGQWELLTGSLVFAPGDTVLQVRVPTVNDGLVEGNEIVALQAQVDSGIVVGGTGPFTAEVTVRDNDAEGTVFESGLAGRSDPSPSTVSGSLGMTDAEGHVLPVTLKAPTEVLTSSSGQTVVWSSDGQGGLVGRAGMASDAPVVASVSVSSDGRYTFALQQPLRHADGSDVLDLHFGVRPVGATSDAGNGTLTVHVVDDQPHLPAVIDTQASALDTNLLIVLDTSNSMNADSGLAGLTRLQAAVQAIHQLIDRYDQSGDVAVRLVTFSDVGQARSDHWLSAADAKALLGTLTASGSGYTNYDDALAAARTAFATDAGKLGDAQNVSYFLSDGNPTLSSDFPTPGLVTFTDASGQTVHAVQNGTTQPLLGDGLSPAETDSWRAFLDAHQIQSHAVGMGTDVTTPYLDPIAYDGQASSDLSGVVVTTFDALQGVLNGSVRDVVSGRLVSTLASAGAHIGADGFDHIVSVTIDGVTHDHLSGGADVQTFTTAAGGVFSIDMLTSAYSYTAPAGSFGPLQEQIGFTLVDRDGDPASAVLRIHVDHTHVQVGTSADDALSGEVSSQFIMGREGNDVLTGGAGNDQLLGNGGQDELHGGAGNDTLVGGAGNDRLEGGAGSDVFAWRFSDAGTATVRAEDHVTDFDAALPTRGGDVLDLRDLLQGEHGSAGAYNLDHYLHIGSEAGSTVIRVSTQADFSASDATAGTETQRIVLDGVDLVARLGAGLSEQQLIAKLVEQGKLLVDA